MDLRLTDYDLDLTNGELTWVMGAEAVAQDVTMRLRTFLGESVYDASAGVPYLQVIFEKQTQTFSVESILRSQILATPGVLSILSFTFEVDPINRVFTGTSKILTTSGEIDFSVGVSL